MEFGVYLTILRELDIPYQKVKMIKVNDCFFTLPEMHPILLCCDGASRGNPGIAGYGFIGRNHEGDFVIAENGNIGIASNFMAELIVIIRAL